MLRLVKNLSFLAVPVLFMELIRVIMEQPFTLVSVVARSSFVASVICVAIATSLLVHNREDGILFLLFWFFISIAFFLVYHITHYTLIAWFLVGCFYVLLLLIEQWMTYEKSMFGSWCWRLFLFVIAGSVPLLLAQIETKFADEEFFVVLEAIVLSIFWTLVLVIYRFYVSCLKIRSVLKSKHRWIITIGVSALAIIGLYKSIYLYHSSFYPSSVSIFPGISEESPFICGQVSPSKEYYDGRDVFERILERLKSNPRKRPPEYGMLALATNELHWAQKFRDEILKEAAANRFTEPANSIKVTQYEAALRVYYYSRVQNRFPGLFSKDDEQVIRDWFAAINRRAQTIEWVDLLYSLAFFNWPDGPFENQGIGAALLSLLETEALSDPKLIIENRKYLERSVPQYSWESIFRVTDDTFIYQPQWMYSAYFQSLYTGIRPEKNVKLSFEWILLQSLSDGGFLRYNHPGKGYSSLIAYLGAKLLGDPRYVWLAGRAVEYLEKNEDYAFAIPGIEEPVPIIGHSPNEGSCLLFGNSGIPGQKGPLAPDKIVFRQSWDTDSMYILVNLRFTGWHRYKATGTVSLVYQQDPIAVEDLDTQPFHWLPKGRSLFRDKRIPRENLNGLSVESIGIRNVLSQLISFSSTWAQDPPYYAEVVAFEPGTDLDYAHIRLTDWHGWNHDRHIYFIRRDALSIIVDTAQSLANSRAALFWHFVDGQVIAKDRIRISTDSGPFEVVFLPLDDDGEVVISNRVQNRGEGINFMYSGRSNLRIATIFLPQKWIGAQVTWNRESDLLQILLLDKRIEMRLK